MTSDISDRQGLSQHVRRFASRLPPQTNVNAIAQYAAGLLAVNRASTPKDIRDFEDAPTEMLEARWDGDALLEGVAGEMVPVLDAHSWVLDDVCFEHRRKVTMQTPGAGKQRRLGRLPRPRFAPRKSMRQIALGLAVVAERSTPLLVALRLIAPSTWESDRVATHPAHDLPSDYGERTLGEDAVLLLEQPATELSRHARPIVSELRDLARGVHLRVRLSSASLTYALPIAIDDDVVANTDEQLAVADFRLEDDEGGQSRTAGEVFSYFEARGKVEFVTHPDVSPRHHGTARLWWCAVRGPRGADGRRITEWLVFEADEVRGRPHRAWVVSRRVQEPDGGWPRAPTGPVHLARDCGGDDLWHRYKELHLDSFAWRRFRPWMKHCAIVTAACASETLDGLARAPQSPSRDDGDAGHLMPETT
jgi:hypothetical protein